MSIDPPADSPTVVAPARKRRFTIRSLMAAVVVVAVVLGWGVAGERCSGRIARVQGQVARWVVGIQAANPTCRGGMTKQGFTTVLLFGSWGEYQADFTTAAGKPIRVSVDLRCSPFGDAHRVVVEASGRAVAWPIQGVDQGRATDLRPIDLRAEFPEAFR